jgi:integrase
MSATASRRPRRRKLPPGVETRTDRAGVRSYRGTISEHGRKRRGPWTTDLAAAERWRSAALIAGATPGAERTLREAAEDWLALAEAGQVATRSGDPYKPATLAGYRQALHSHVLPVLGGTRLGDLDAPTVNRWVARLQHAGLSPSTIRNATLPLRAIIRRAVAYGDLPANPLAGGALLLPAVRGYRDRTLTAEQAREYVAALPEAERALWAMALYTGLRRGELAALRWSDVNLAGGFARVTRSWSYSTSTMGTPKSAAGVRVVPLPELLRPILTEHGLATRREGDALVFGATPGAPFTPNTVASRARRAWKAAGLVPLTLHECRHCFASLAVHLGVPMKSLQGMLGHSSYVVTADRYSHLLPGAQAEAGALLDAGL